MERIVCLLLLSVFSVAGFAQSKTITNADLEKFRVKRLAAEKDLRENHKEMGFPSPEELRRQNERSSRELSKNAEALRQQQIELARQRAQSIPSEVIYYYPQQGGRNYSGSYFWGYAGRNYFGGRYNKRYRTNRKRGAGFISNPIIRANWLRQSKSMRQTYRGNFRSPKTRNRR